MASPIHNTQYCQCSFWKWCQCFSLFWGVCRVHCMGIDIIIRTSTPIRASAWSTYRAVGRVLECMWARPDIFCHSRRAPVPTAPLIGTVYHTNRLPEGLSLNAQIKPETLVCWHGPSDTLWRPDDLLQAGFFWREWVLLSIAVSPSFYLGTFIVQTTSAAYRYFYAYEVSLSNTIQ